MAMLVALRVTDVSFTYRFPLSRLAIAVRYTRDEQKQDQPGGQKLFHCGCDHGYIGTKSFEIAGETNLSLDTNPSFDFRIPWVYCRCIRASLESYQLHLLCNDPDPYLCFRIQNSPI